MDKYTPRQWLPTKSPACQVHPPPPARTRQTPGLWRGRSFGGDHRWPGQCPGHGQSVLPTRCPGRDQRRDGLAARRVRDDQRLDEPAAGEVSSAVRPACLHRSVHGALRPGHLRPFVRQRPELGHRGARRPRHGRCGLELVGSLLHDPGLPRPMATQGHGVGPWRLATGGALARVFSEDLLQIAEWRGLYMFELGLALAALGCVLQLKLPPGVASRPSNLWIF